MRLLLLLMPGEFRAESTELWCQEEKECVAVGERVAWNAARPADGFARGFLNMHRDYKQNGCGRDVRGSEGCVQVQAKRIALGRRRYGIGCYRTTDETEEPTGKHEGSDGHGRNERNGSTEPGHRGDLEGGWDTGDLADDEEGGDAKGRNRARDAAGEVGGEEMRRRLEGNEGNRRRCDSGSDKEIEGSQRNGPRR